MYGRRPDQSCCHVLLWQQQQQQQHKSRQQWLGLVEVVEHVQHAGLGGGAVLGGGAGGHGGRWWWARLGARYLVSLKSA